MNTFSLIYNENINQQYILISDCPENNIWYISNNSKIIEVQDLYIISSTQFSQQYPKPFDSWPSFSIDYNLSSSTPHFIFHSDKHSDIFDLNVIKYEINQKKEDLVKNFTEIINKIEIGKKYEFKGDDFLLIIKPTNSSYLENTTHVNFTQCENLLREVLNISSSRILTFLQMEINNNNEKSLVNKVEYQVYDDNKTLLDLSICNDTNIKIFYTVKDEQLNLLSYSSYKDLGIDIFNINDSFFNDICHPFSDSKNDIVLKDRIKDIFQNYSLCDEGCTYNEFIYEYNTISCDCKVKTNISTNESLALNLKKLDEIKLDSNFGIIKCYNLVFSFSKKDKNIGFWIFIFLIFIQIPFLFNFYCKGIKTINEYIYNETANHGHIKKESINRTSKNNSNKSDDKENKDNVNKIQNLIVNSPPKKNYNDK